MAISSEYVSPSGGISYGLEYPFRYKEDGESWVVFSILDGWVNRRFRFSDEDRGDRWGQRFFSEMRAQAFCGWVNGFDRRSVSADVLAEIDAQE